ncbi:M28 family metallopeptidase [Candidatus Lokiarchaeum ossiferum]|uniref:M28 family metallopeptidase n=1 Tax=Candidatus Lokiarchaeum ossiferum TaxID=2951803 RepID=UPI00352F0ED9
MTQSNQPTFDILKNSILCRPRMMGTKGEKETTQFLMEFLTKHHIESHTEDIEWSTASVNGRKLMFILLGLFGILINSTLRIIPPINGILSILLIPISFLSLMLFGKKLKADKFKRFGKSAIGKNVICEFSPIKHEKTEPTIIYLTAHSDSVASNLPKFYIKFMMGMFFGFLLILLLTLVSSIISLVYFFRDDISTNLAIRILNVVILILTILVILIITFNMFAKRINTSPGACDNGSGSAILLSLAKYYKENPTENILLKFIWCTAEEWGLFGSKGYVKTHKQEIVENKDNSYVINVDMVGSELAYLDKAGLLKKKPINTKLNLLIEKSAEELKIEARKFNSPIGGNSDHASFKKEKVEVCCFLAKNDTKIIHSKKDTIDLVKPEKLEDAVELIKNLVQKIGNGEIISKD